MSAISSPYLSSFWRANIRIPTGFLLPSRVSIYAFANGGDAGGTYITAITDRATNQTTVPFTVTRDAVAPTVALTLPERIAAGDILVQWSATDLGSGVQHVDVEYRIANGEWQRWLTSTTQTQAIFPGTPGVAYTFRVRATDNVNNASDWVQAVVKAVVVTKYYTVAGQGVAVRENDVLYYLHTDHLSSASLTTDAAGAIHAQQRYDPYGPGALEQRVAAHRPAVHRPATRVGPGHLRLPGALLLAQGGEVHLT